MDKAEILDILARFPYPREDYWVIAGSAMVLYGIRERTHDIDLGCTSKMADLLERDGFLEGRSQGGGRQFRYGEDIEIFENWLEGAITTVEGFQTVTVEGLIEMKRELGREKDLRDLRLIEEYLKNKQSPDEG